MWGKFLFFGLNSPTTVSLIIACLFLIQGCGGGVDTPDIPFTVVNLSPDDNQGSVSVSSKLEVKFTRPVEKNTITGNTFWLLNEHTHEKETGKIELTEGNSKVIFTPDSLFYDTHYSVNIHHSITDSGGSHLSGGTRKWSFFTQPRPPIFNMQPDRGATGVNTNASVRVEFENTVNPATLNNTSFYVLDLQGFSINGNIVIDKNFAEFKPLQPLALNTLYRVALETSILDVNNNVMFDFPVEWNFTTRLEASSTFHVGTSGSDDVRAMAVDAQNQLIVAGRTNDVFPLQVSKGEFDGFVAKFDAFGRSLWTTQFGTELFDTITGMQLTSNGDIFLSGHNDQNSFGSNMEEQSDIFLALVDSAGVYRWTQKFGDSSGHDFSQGIVKDSKDNLYISGVTMGALAGFTNQGSHDLVLAKYDVNGNQLWAKQFGGSGDEQLFGILNINDIVYLGVQTIEPIESSQPTPTPMPTPGGPTIFPPFFNIQPETRLYAIDESGNKLWDQSVGTEIMHTVAGMRMLSNGNIILTGSGPNPVDFSENIVVKQINPQTGLEISTSNLSLDQSFFIDVMNIDSTGNIYVSGTKFIEPLFPPPGSGMGGPISFEPQIKLFVQKLSSDGSTPVWTVEVPVENHATMHSLLVDSAGETIVSGSAHGGVDGNTISGEQDGFVLRIDVAGKLK